jgi:hypothetical protein
MDLKRYSDTRRADFIIRAIHRFETENVLERSPRVGRRLRLGRNQSKDKLHDENEVTVATELTRKLEITGSII